MRNAVSEGRKIACQMLLQDKYHRTLNDKNKIAKQ